MENMPEIISISSDILSLYAWLVSVLLVLLFTVSGTLSAVIAVLYRSNELQKKSLMDSWKSMHTLNTGILSELKSLRVATDRVFSDEHYRFNKKIDDLESRILKEIDKMKKEITREAIKND